MHNSDHIDAERAFTARQARYFNPSSRPTFSLADILGETDVAVVEERLVFPSTWLPTQPPKRYREEHILTYAQAIAERAGLTGSYARYVREALEAGFGEEEAIVFANLTRAERAEALRLGCVQVHVEVEADCLVVEVDTGNPFAALAALRR